MQRLTILTSPVSRPKAIDFAYNLLRFLRSAAQGRFEYDLLKYGGHYAVTRSLVEGLRQLNVEFNYNPKIVSDVHENAVVLSGVEALHEAISLKKFGKIKKLFAGPNVMSMPDDFGNILSAEEIDACLAPSEIAEKIYERLNPSLKGKMAAWYAGVNENFWAPDKNPKADKNVLVYCKDAPRVFCVHIEKLLSSLGFSIHRVTYGKYSPIEFKRALSQSRFAIFLSITETQGLALAEAWAMDVPTLVWDPKIEHYFIKDLIVTSAPYLSAETGVSFKEVKDLQNLLENLNQLLPKFSPRQWILGHMTDLHSARLLVKLFEQNNNDRPDRT